jgi:glyoxalase superfamily protein
MHRSRFSTLLIDVPAAEVPAAASFWSAALGLPARPIPDEPEFTHLHGEAVAGLSMALQSIDGEPRYHLDIETDDPDAETARLLALGAVEVGRWLGARTLRAPGGHLLCVIPQHSDDETFDRYAQVWD